MDKALLYRENEEPRIVSAEDVKNGKYNRNDQFVDPEYEFRVQYVKGAKHNGVPYFRFYYSYEDYKRLFPESADRYAIVANMRHYEENLWHREWKSAVSDFCKIEECIKNTTTGKWRFPDAFFEKQKTCIEFQNSYISFDFKERNTFYSDLSFKTIWLYNLPDAVIKTDGHGYFEILEDNSRGFFRISENPDNLKNNIVFIQARSKQIYRVTELLRRNIPGDLKSTIRIFPHTEVYSEIEFIDAIKDDRIQYHPISSSPYYNINSESNSNKPTTDEGSSIIPQPLSKLWDSTYIWMVVRNTETEDEIMINRDGHGNMFRDLYTKEIRYKYVDHKHKLGYRSLRDEKEYKLPQKQENRSIWILLRTRYL